MNAIQNHSCFGMWKPAANTLFQMALATDPEGAQRFWEFQQALGAEGNAEPALGAFLKTHAGKLYRAITLERKITIL